MSQKKGDDKEQNIFILNSLYPEADSVFSFKPRSLEEIKNTCLVVLDTNVLLVPFDTGKESLQQIKTTYQDLVEAKRLVIPGRVAREFAKNRAEKLKTLYQQVSLKQNSSISRASYPLLESSEEYQKLIETEKELDSKLSNYRKQVAALLDKIRGWYWDDPVSSLYRELFSDQVVVDIVHNEDELRLDLENRQLHKIPPGFQDAAKEDKGVGDLLIWLTILELGGTRKQDVLFVTNDSKNDWRYQSKKQALYPRFELIEEYRQHSDGKTIHVINFSEFLQLFGSNSQVVEEVRQEENSVRFEVIQLPLKSSDLVSQAKFAVGEWIRQSYPDSYVHYGTSSFLDFLVDDPVSGKIGFELKVSGAPRDIVSSIQSLASRAEVILAQGAVDKFVFVWVLDEPDRGTQVLETRPTNSLQSEVSLMVGVMSSDNSFIPKLCFQGAGNSETKSVWKDWI